MKSLIAAGALLALSTGFAGTAAAQDNPPAPAPAPAPAPVVEPMTVYGTNALGPGWEIWPWEGATVTPSYEVAGSSRRPILIEAQGWKGLYLHRAAFGTAGYHRISFLIQSIGEPGQIMVKAVANGAPIPDMQRVVPVTPGGWRRVEFELSEIGAQDVTIDGLWFQNASPDPSPRFVIAEIMLKP